MIIKQLKIENFGPFEGHHTFDLEPKQPDRPIVLIGGRNGTGKTSILEAVRLCLYGRKAVGRVSTSAYQVRLKSIFHQTRTGDAAAFASVALEIEVVESGVRQIYTVTRSWNRKKDAVSENLDLYRDNLPIGELYPEQYQTFLDELVPIGVSDLFFFDGERIQRLAGEESADPEMVESIRRLLGLDLTEKLRADLSILMRNKNGTRPSGDLQKELASEQDRLLEIDALINDLHERIDANSEELTGITQEVEILENKITAEGGDFAVKREGLLIRQTELEASIHSSELELRELASGPLPFALIPNLCTRLMNRVNDEAASRRLSVEKEIVKQVQDSIAEALDEPSFWTEQVGFEPPDEIRARLRDAVAQHLMKSSGDLETVEPSPVHDLSDKDSLRLASDIKEALEETPVQVTEASNKFEHALHELHIVEKDLQRVPREEVLQPLLRELNQVQVKFGKTRSEHDSLEDKMRAAQYEKETHERNLVRLCERFDGLEQHGRKLALAAKVRSTLKSYEQDLVVAKIDRLNSSVTECLQLLAHKDLVCRRVEFDPITFSVSLFNAQDRIVPKGQLSAGEKQILAIAILWGLGRASGRQLPVIIDTPLARLDAEHRSRLVTHYFPNASHQVVLLSTDTEIDQQSKIALEPRLARTYHLQFDGDTNSTSVESGYFKDLAGVI